MVTTLLLAALLGATGQATGHAVETDLSARPATATGSTQGRALKDRLAERVNVKDFGAKGDGVTDDAAAIQSALNYAAPGNSSHDRYLYFPPGTYIVGSSITLPDLRFRISGEGTASKIVGNFAGWVLDKVSGNTAIVDGPSIIEKLWIQQLNTAADSAGAIRWNGAVNAIVRDVRIDSYGRGIQADNAVFTFTIENVRLQGYTSTHTGTTIGALVSGHASILHSDIVGWDEGVRANGAGLTMNGCRLEVNVIGLRLGYQVSGASDYLGRSSITGLSFEANDTSIVLNNLKDSVVSGIGMQGSTNAPSGQSKYGIKVLTPLGGTIGPMDIGGSFDTSAVYIEGGTNAMFTGIRASNALGVVWDVRNDPLSTGNSFEQCTYTPRGATGETPLPYVLPALHTAGISGIDLLAGTTQAKNLRGKNLQVNNGASYLDVVFATTTTAGVAALNTATATTGGTLAAGTYYYTSTIANELGESATTGERTATVDGSTTTAVRLTPYGISSGTVPWRYRIYRGTASGVYDGYFDLPLRSNAAFTDTGGAFTGKKSVPLPGENAPSGAEPDTNYAVTCSPQFDATCWVSNKTTDGFRLNFDPAAATTSAVDWHLIR